MKKNHLASGLILSALFIVLTGCVAITDLLKLDLKVKLVVDNLKGIHENTLIYKVEQETEKAIGRVTKVKATDNGQPVVYLKIDSEYRDLIREGSLFVVIRPLLSVDPPHILVDTLPKDMENPPLKSDAIVYETSYVKYGLMEATNALTDVLDVWKNFMKDLDDYLKSDDFDQFLKHLKQSAEDIGNYSMEQKQRFEKDILPQIEEKTGQAIKALQEKSENGLTADLQKEMNELKQKLRAQKQEG